MEIAFYLFLLLVGWVGKIRSFGIRAIPAPRFRRIGANRFCPSGSQLGVAKESQSLHQQGDCDHPHHHDHKHDHSHHDEDHHDVVENDDTTEAPSLQHTKQNFYQLLQKVMAVTDPQHLPSLLTRHMDLILALSGQDGVAVIQSILDEAREHDGDNNNTNNNNTTVAQLEQAIELTLSFAEDFVQTALSLDDQNKQVLGKIITAMSNKELAPLAREEALDKVFQQERSHFRAGFLRHLQGECDALEKRHKALLAAAGGSSEEVQQQAQHTLTMLRIIQSRVLQEIGQDLGDGAQILQQLIGYDDSAERTAVLEAGLMVRGTVFAQELQMLTAEALHGLARVPAGQGADPELIRRVQSIDQGITRYLEQNASFQ